MATSSSPSLFGKVETLVQGILNSSKEIGTYVMDPLSDIEKNAFKFLVLSTTIITLITVLFMNGLLLKTICYFILIIFLLFLFYYITADDTSRNRINSVWYRLNVIFNQSVTKFMDAWFGSASPPTEQNKNASLLNTDKFK